MVVPSIRRVRLLDELTPMPRLVRMTAPAGYGKTTLARALLTRTSGAVCDLGYVATPRDLVRSAVEALVACDDGGRAEVAAQFLALGDDNDTWLRFGRSIFGATGRQAVVCFENGESIAERVDLIRVLGDLLRDADERTCVIICSRVQLDVELGRFAGPDATRVIDASELRFDRDEIGRAFGGMSLGAEVLGRIDAFTGGWPIVVMMLQQLAKRGRLREFLIGGRDESDLYGYLATEVNRFLSSDERELLVVLSAIPDATERDVIALFPAYTELLRGLRDLTPFVSDTPRGTIDVHPAMREMLLARTDREAILERIIATLPRDDGGLRAAQIAIHLDRPREAARALQNLGAGFLLTTVGPELSAVLSAIPSDVLADFPELWSIATTARAFTIDPIAWIEQGERVYSMCTPQTPDMVRGGIAMSLINAYLNRGRWDDITAFSKRFVNDSRPDFRPFAQAIVGFWVPAMDAYRGRAVDTSVYETRYASFLENPAARSLTEYDVIARDHRIRGDHARSRAVLDRAVERARATRLPLVLAIITLDAAFNAWFFGDDIRFARYLDELESAVIPSVERGVRFFISCARGHAKHASFGYEKLKTRAFAFLIAGALERDPLERRRYLQEAVVAADHADQPFAQVIAYTALGITVGGVSRDRALDEAQRIADRTCSAALRVAVTRAWHGDASSTMLATFLARFDAVDSVAPSSRVVVDLHSRAITIADEKHRITEPEADHTA